MMQIKEGRVFSLTVANGAAVSGTVDGRFWESYILESPAAMTNTVLNFEVSTDQVTWTPLYDAANTLVAVTIAVNRAHLMPPSVGSAVYWRMKFPGNEAALRTFKLHAKS